jgi:hypothetical protein
MKNFKKCSKKNLYKVLFCISITMKTAEEIALAKEKRTTYMREYKRREYAAKHDEMKAKQRLYYLLNKCNRENVTVPLHITDTQFVKVLLSLNQIKTDQPDILRAFLQDYIETEF